MPETVRRALKLHKRDKIHYSILPDGAVLLTRATQAEGEDPVLGQFLDFLAQDIASHPQRLLALDVDLVHRIQSLVGGEEVNIDAPCRLMKNERIPGAAFGHQWLDDLCSSAVPRSN